MEEARRFIRYVVPGLALFLEIILILLLNQDFRTIKKYSDLGTVLMTFFASGIVGFIFSNFYYVIYWEMYLNQKHLRKINYKELIENNRDLKIVNIDQTIHSQREAWCQLNTYFNLNYGEKMAYYEQKTGSIANILASIGTTLVITIVSLIVGEFFLLKTDESKIIFFFINFILIIALTWNYQITASILQHLYNSILDWIRNNPGKLLKVPTRNYFFRY